MEESERQIGLAPTNAIALAHPANGHHPVGDGNPNGLLEMPAGRIQAEAPAQIRRKARIALIQEFGGESADYKKVALEAIRRGMYSLKTNPGDVELCLIRTWKLRHRGYRR